MKGDRNWPVEPVPFTNPAAVAAVSRVEESCTAAPPSNVSGPRLRSPMSAIAGMITWVPQVPAAVGIRHANARPIIISAPTGKRREAKSLSEMYPLSTTPAKPPNS